jgi:hypothetical protein
MAMWSNPAHLREEPKKPPQFASPRIPVKGDLAEMVQRGAEGAEVPERGLVPKRRRFRGDKGEISGPTSS